MQVLYIKNVKIIKSTKTSTIIMFNKGKCKYIFTV